MKLAKKSIINNIAYSMLSNVVSMIVAVMSVLLLPKILSLTEYGLWQLFLFYFSYLGFFHFGLEDGIFLRYAGMRYEDLDKSIILGQCVFVILSQSLMGGMVCLFADFFSDDIAQNHIVRILGVLLLVVNGNNLFSFIFQMTSRVKDYAKLNAIEPVLFTCAIILVILCGFRDSKTFIYCKCFSLSVATIISLYLLRDLFKAKLPRLLNILSEVKTNIIIGSRLMLANIASSLMIGIIRFGISRAWDVATFGKISMVLSISNFLLVFINAVSVVILPVLKNINKNEQKKIYFASRGIVTAVMLSALMLYFPIYYVLSQWLHQFLDALNYMAILFPICLYESRMSLFINVYLKALRLEKTMLKVNIIAIVISAFFTMLSVIVFHSLWLCAGSIVLILAIRAYLSELQLLKIIGGSIQRNVFFEVFMIIIYLFTTTKVGGIYGMLLYMCMLFFYLIANSREIKRSLNVFKNT